MSADGGAVGLKRSGIVDMESNTTLVQQFPAHEAVPGGSGPFPSILVLHDIYGLDLHARGTANRLAHSGYYALAPNLYGFPFSVADGAPGWMSASYQLAGDQERLAMSVASTFRPSERVEASSRAEGLSDRRALEIVSAAVGHLRRTSEARSSRVGVLGFGLGAHVAFLAACEFSDCIGAAALFEPIGIASARRRRPGDSMPLLRYEQLSGPVLVFWGGQDAGIRTEEREAVEKVLTAAGKPHEIIAFPEAGPDFYNEESGGYRIGAARQAWERTLQLFDDALR